MSKSHRVRHGLTITHQHWRDVTQWGQGGEIIPHLGADAAHTVGSCVWGERIGAVGGLPGLLTVWQIGEDSLPCSATVSALSLPVSSTWL